ncbi:MAG: creatininase family protein [Chloroflexota bacterium]
MLLKDMKWPEAKEAMERGAPVIVVVGSTEQHGPHLPLSTDVDLPMYVATKAADKVGALVAPPVNFGYNEKEWKFPGTISLKTETLTAVLYDIVESLSRSGFRYVILLNGHGFNTNIVAQVSHMAMEKLPILCASVSYWNLVLDVAKEVRESERGGMSHACEFETSGMLHANPEHVDMSKAVDEFPKVEGKFVWLEIIETSPIYIRPRWDILSDSGVCGRPTLATAEKGRMLLDTAADRLAAFLESFTRDFEHFRG